MSTEWINAEEKKPPSCKRVLLAYINSSKKNRVVAGHYTEKFIDENYDQDVEFFEYDEESDNNYVPCGWYEDSFSHEEYAGYWLENQDVLFWAEFPKFPKIEELKK